MDFLILFLFADFLSENPSNFTEFNVKCKKSAKSWISNFTYFIWVGSLRNNALGVIRGPIFETWVRFRGCVHCDLCGVHSYLYSVNADFQNTV